ncbi:MAG: AAA family ATPase [Bifidobacterium breve]
MIVTIANAKGGVAKTTSAIYLAAAYARRFEEGATVLDADPQSSASLWRDMAEENGGWPAGTDVMPANLSTLQRLARAGHGGFAVVDAPPQGRLFEESVKAADFVVVPTSDSPIDLRAGVGDDERDSRWQARCGAHRARRTPHPSLPDDRRRS